MTYQGFIGLFSIVFATIGYGSYIYTVLKHRTKPHIFSWLVWSVLVFAVFLAQVSKGAGAGAWVTGFSALAYLVIAALAIKYGEKNITWSDWITFVGALMIIPAWWLTHNPLWAVILATAIDLLGYYPTFRKSYSKPYEENYFLHFVDSIKWVIAFFALSDYSATTLIYPALVCIADMHLACMILWRRSRVKQRR